MSVAWFVDGAYFSNCWNAVSQDDPDWLAFQEKIESVEQEEITCSYYFDATDDPTAAAANPFYNFMRLPRPDGPAFRVILGSLQRRELRWPERMGGGAVVHPDSGESFVQQYQKEVDVLLAFNLVRSQMIEGWRTLYLIAGDKDFFEVVKHLVENEGVKVHIFGLRKSKFGTPTVSPKYGPYAKFRYFEDFVSVIERRQVSDG